MKKFFFIFVVFVLVSSGCGADDEPTDSGAESGDSTTISGGTKGRFATIHLGAGQAQPRIDPSELPPPKKTLVRDIEVGKGPVAHKGDQVAVYYFGVDYGTGKREYFRWPPADPYEMPLAAAAAWEKSIVGMRVGGIRDMVIPSRLAFGTGALEYIVDLRAVRPASEAGRGSGS